VGEVTVTVWSPVAEQAPAGPVEGGPVQVDLGREDLGGVPPGFGQGPSRWSTMNEDP